MSYLITDLTQVVTKTGAYALQSSDSVVLISAPGGGCNLTLPTAVGALGKAYTLTRTNQSLADLVTIATTSSQTIGAYGTSVTLATQNESWQLVSDGSNWQVLSHTIPMVWTAYTPTVAGYTWANTQCVWARKGTNIIIMMQGSTTSASATTATFGLPSGLNTAASTILRSASPYSIVGPPIGNNGGSPSLYMPIAQSGVTYFNIGIWNAVSDGYITTTGTGNWGNATVSIIAELPVANWNG